MKFVVEITLGSVNMQDHHDVARTLDRIRAEISTSGFYRAGEKLPILDGSGNTVGYCALVPA